MRRRRRAETDGDGRWIRAGLRAKRPNRQRGSKWRTMEGNRRSVPISPCVDRPCCVCWVFRFRRVHRFPPRASAFAASRNLRYRPQADTSPGKEAGVVERRPFSGPSLPTASSSGRVASHPARERLSALADQTLRSTFSV